MFVAVHYGRVKTHHYSLAVTWTGNRGSGTTGPSSYDRDHWAHPHCFIARSVNFPVSHRPTVRVAG
jgi:organic hydroperoxide reductase OsmC/OhrA